MLVELSVVEQRYLAVREALDTGATINGIRHLLTAPYSPTTTGKIERLHKTMRKEFFARASFASIEQAQADLDRWVAHYNRHREHQGIGDVAPIRRFELAEKRAFDVVDDEVEVEPEPEERPRSSPAASIRRDASASSSTATTWGATLPANR